MPATRKLWKEWEEDYLEKAYLGGVSIVEISNKLRKSKQSVYHHARLMGFKRRFYRTGGNFYGPRPDDIEDVDWVIYHLRNRENLSTAEIGGKLGLSKGQIQHRLYSRGLHMHPPMGPAPEWFVNNSK